MDFDFTAEQKQFQDQLRRALEATSPLTEARRVLEGKAPFSQPAWKTLKELGATGIVIPDTYGGLGLSHYELCLAAEESGRALASTPLSSSIFLAAEAVLRFGSIEQKAAFLPGLASGESIMTWWADASPRADRPRLAAGRLSGRASPVLDARIAGAALVLAEEQGKPVIAVVSLDQPGVAIRDVATLDPSRPAGELTFQDAPAERLGAPGQGAQIAADIEQRAAVLVAFEQVGGAERALRMAREYALQRVAFGRLIGSYQAIKHKLANVYIKLEIARAHALYAAWALSTDAPELPLAAAAARVAATDAFAFAAQENIQTHGGIGFTWESDCQLLYRRARLLALQFGGALTWKGRLMRELETRNAA